MTNNPTTIAAALRRQAEAETILPEHTLMLAAANEIERIQTTGLALRDWFAGLAMVSIRTARGGFDERVAQEAYEMADAMLKAREVNQWRLR